MGHNSNTSSSGSMEFQSSCNHPSVILRQVIGEIKRVE
jgi:hypothetical protein